MRKWVPALRDQWGQALLTYPDSVDALHGSGPAGFAVIEGSRLLSGTAFSVARERLFTYFVHEGAGLRVESSEPTVTLDGIVRLRIGVGPIRVTAVNRITRVVDEPGRAGFAYGSLDIHPESGEEVFLLEDGDEGLRFTIRAVSRPRAWYARLAGPITRRAQRWYLQRYLQSIG